MAGRVRQTTLAGEEGEKEMKKGLEREERDRNLGER